MRTPILALIVFFVIGFLLLLRVPKMQEISNNQMD
jgi:competence protein ComGC